MTTNKKLKVIITSGGIISKVDDIRRLGNFSQGTTGALIAEEFLKAGAEVHYVYGKDTKRPFLHRLFLNPRKDFDEEVARMQKEYRDFHSYSGYLKEYQTETFDEYYAKVKNLAETAGADVVILAAAVTDYSAKTQVGKISSDLYNFQIDLVKNEKVIFLIKKWNPNIFQVGFKLLSNASMEELIDTGYHHGLQNHSNLTVANSIVPGSNFKKRVTVFITPEKGIEIVELEDVAKKLVGKVMQRFSKNHYKTQLTLVDNFRNINGHLRKFKDDVKTLWQYNLFEPYFEGANAQFGFVAARTGKNSFLITARGSDKKDITDEDITHVTKVDFKNRNIYVTSLGKKASLNATVAAKIFATRPETQIIVHSHVFLGVQNKTAIDFSPGTNEDIEEIMKYLSKGEKIVELKNHGVIVAGITVKDIIAAINISPAYANFPEFYDIVYNRFQQNDDFINLINFFIGREQSILDLAAGTGALSMQLVKRDYENIYLADKSPGMLKTAMERVKEAKGFYLATIEEMPMKEKFDAIIVRQAINYLMKYDNLAQAMKGIYGQLSQGGRLIFNAPNYVGESVYADKNIKYATAEWNVAISEKNIVQNKVVTHAQNCLLVKKDNSEIKKIYDLNAFGLFTKDEFENALREAGFSEINFFYKGLVTDGANSKTLYVVAKR